MTARLRRVSDELADALSVKGEYEGRVLRAEEDVAAMTELLAQAERDRDEARAEQELHDSQATVDNLRAEIESLKRQLSTMNDSNEAHQTRIRELEIARSELQEELESSRAEAKAAAKEAADRIEELETQLAEVREKLAGEMQDHESTKQRVAELEEQLDSIMKAQQAELEVERAEVTTREEAISTLGSAAYNTVLNA
ncbi:hypothetical protein PPROV_000258800 [Pycnococcus provasolii]|uniref:Uncharacterized protein n=1 Tax=Pycnococcus provasolii TaxID=41880 RepID=A0A830H9S2_9CHLO|nr:hypothetical protein PPROV_000258800 [Pycnococcus provasolii]